MKKLFRLFPLVFSFALAGCGPNTANTNSEDLVEPPTSLEQETSTPDTSSTTAPTTDSDLDYCEQYINMMQCLVDNYPNDVEGAEDIDNLRDSIYNQDISEDLRQSMCAFSLTMMQAAVQGEEYDIEEDMCGLFEFTPDDTDEYDNFLQ